jgi:ketosteroid isomerase-like protein
LLTVVLVLLPFYGCSTCQEEGLPPDLLETIDAFYASIEAGDGESRIEMFTEDALMLPNHWTRYEGKETIEEVIRGGEGWGFRLRDREVVDSAASGSLAYTVNAYFYTWHKEGDEPQWHRTKNVHIWKKGDDGAWRLHVDIWNSDVPIDRFAEE